MELVLYSKLLKCYIVSIILITGLVIFLVVHDFLTAV